MSTVRRLSHSLIALAVLSGALIPAVASANETVMVCDIYGNHVGAVAMAIEGIGTSSRCPGNAAPNSYTRTRHPGGMAIWTTAHKTVAEGRSARWKIVAPRGLAIASVYVPHMYSHGINDGTGWGGGFYWIGGSGGVHTRDGERGWSSASRESLPFRWPVGGTRVFGWQIACRTRRCHGGSQWLTTELLELRVRETRRPHPLSRGGLWPSTGWIRGQWTLRLTGRSPSGFCSLSASFDNTPIAASHSQHDSARWQQCAAPALDQVVSTAEFGDGVFPLKISGRDAAGSSFSDQQEVEVDNQVPTISLSGPRTASSTAGTEHVRATAAAGPSGVAGISCSVDRAATRWYSSASAEVPVRGVGVHEITCYSQNNARSETGRAARSPSARWTLSIRSPSISTISFVKPHRRGREPLRWRLARSRRGSVHQLRVPFRSRATVAGWLGTASGKGIAGQPIRLMAAVNGGFAFRQIAVVRTAHDGLWSVRLPPGPSRTVIAAYDGTPTIEPSSSDPVHLSVSAALKLHIHPTATRWGSTIRIRGRVRGGHIPPAGELVVLRVGWAGGSAVMGDLYTGQNGRCSTEYTFRQGVGTQTYWIRATSARESAYPYAPGRSKRIRVTVTP